MRLSPNLNRTCGLAPDLLSTFLALDALFSLLPDLLSELSNRNCSIVHAQKELSAALPAPRPLGCQAGGTVECHVQSRMHCLG